MPLRLLAAACGFTAAVLALGFGWWSDPAVFVHVADPHGIEFVLVVVAIHLAGLIAIAGGALYLLNASLARMTSLAAAVGWVLIAAVHGGGITWPLALVTLLSSAAGAIGFLPPFRDEAPDDRVRPPRLRSAASARDADKLREQPMPSPALDADEDHSKPFVSPPPSWPTPTIDRPRAWTSDLPAHSPQRKRPRRKRQVAAGAFGLAVLLLGGATFGYIAWSEKEPNAELAETAKAPSTAATPALRSEKVPAASSASSHEPPVMAALPSLPYAFSPDAASAEATGNLGAVPSASADAAGNLGTVPAAPASTQIAALPEVSALTASSSQASLATSFATPGDYCASNANMDAPDLAKVSGGTQDLYIRARAAAKLAQGDVHWRCMDGAVWTCATTTGGLACDKIPTSVDRVLICAAHPDATGIRTAGGDWSCDGFTPVVTPAQLQAPDRRGFDKDAWHKL